MKLEIEEVLMSKKDQAFELFSQGKKPNDPELEVLGLKKESKRKYFGDWKMTKAKPIIEEVPVVVEEVPVAPVPLMVRASLLKNGDTFEFNGEIYRAGKSRDCVLGANLNRPHAVVLTLGLNAMVKLVR